MRATAERSGAGRHARRLRPSGQQAGPSEGEGYRLHGIHALAQEEQAHGRGEDGFAGPPAAPLEGSGAAAEG